MHAVEDKAHSRMDEKKKKTKTTKKKKKLEECTQWKTKYNYGYVLSYF